MRPVIGFDCDGVVCQGGYLPPDQRSVVAYANLKLLDKCIPDVINNLTRWADVYFVSSRNHDNALHSTHVYLQSMGIEMSWIKGLLVGIPSWNKPTILRMLNVELFFDDDPAAVGGYDKAVLVSNSGWAYNREIWDRFHPDQRVTGWEEIIAKISGRFPSTKIDSAQLMLPFEEVLI